MLSFIKTSLDQNKIVLATKEMIADVKIPYVYDEAADEIVDPKDWEEMAAKADKALPDLLANWGALTPQQATQFIHKLAEGPIKEEVKSIAQTTAKATDFSISELLNALQSKGMHLKSVQLNVQHHELPTLEVAYALMPDIAAEVNNAIQNLYSGSGGYGGGYSKHIGGYSKW